jgi:allophanate hydrolase
VQHATSTPTLGLEALQAGYTTGTLRVRDVVEDVLARIARRGDDAVWIHTTPDEALHARAAELDALAPGERGPLHGVPVAVKDNIDVAGLPTTAACPAFAYRPPMDAGSVARLRAAGALVVGKTNLDQFATGLNGTRSPYGAPESVFGGDLISGGSSSGSAVAVAAGLVPLALGTDTAGSGRVPAAMNGIVGLKPTRGLVGTSGVVPACRSLDCVSIFAQDVADAATALDVLAGPDADDPWSRPSRPLPVPEQFTVALPGDLDVDAFAGDAAMAAAFAAVAQRVAARAGSTITTTTGPLLEAGDLLYTGPWVAERLAGLADFLAEHPGDVHPVVRAVVERGAGVTGVETFRARHRLQELRAWAARLFTRADVLLLPTVPTTFTRAELAADPLARNLVLGRFTQATNLLDLAALALPAGTTADGPGPTSPSLRSPRPTSPSLRSPRPTSPSLRSPRPLGVTLVGPAFSEARLLAAAAVLGPFVRSSVTPSHPTEEVP